MGGAPLILASPASDAGLTLFLDQARNPQPGGSVLYFQVNDVEESHRRLQAAGVRFLREPQKFYWGYGAELADPDGHVIRLWDEKSMRKQEEPG